MFCSNVFFLMQWNTYNNSKQFQTITHKQKNFTAVLFNRTFKLSAKFHFCFSFVHFLLPTQSQIIIYADWAVAFGPLGGGCLGSYIGLGNLILCIQHDTQVRLFWDDGSFSSLWIGSVWLGFLTLLGQHDFSKESPIYFSNEKKTYIFEG